MPDALTLRPATADDIPQILAFIRGLAEYEKLLDDCVATEDALRATLFGDRPYAEVLLAEWEGVPAGFALYFHNYSTFRARPGIYLEDLFVLPTHRGRGIGKALLTRLGEIAVDRGCVRLEWSVLDWNQPAIDFYQSLGARPLDEWTIYRVTDQALEALGG